MAHTSDEATILSGVNAEFIAGLYARWLDDPAGVDDSWAAFFTDLKDDSHTLLRELSGASWTPPHMAQAAATRCRANWSLSQARASS